MDFFQIIFNKDFDLNKFKNFFSEFFSSLKEFITKSEKIYAKLFENTFNALTVEKNKISEIVTKMCEVIIDETLNANLSITEKTKGIFNKTSFSDGICMFKEEVIKANDLNMSIIFECYKKHVYGFITVDEQIRKIISKVISIN